MWSEGSDFISRFLSGFLCRLTSDPVAASCPFSLSLLFFLFLLACFSSASVGRALLALSDLPVAITEEEVEGGGREEGGLSITVGSVLKAVASVEDVVVLTEEREGCDRDDDS